MPMPAFRSESVQLRQLQQRRRFARKFALQPENSTHVSFPRYIVASRMVHSQYSCASCSSAAAMLPGSSPCSTCNTDGIYTALVLCYDSGRTCSQCDCGQPPIWTLDLYSSPLGIRCVRIAFSSGPPRGHRRCAAAPGMHMPVRCDRNRHRSKKGCLTACLYV